jgi:L-cysteine/cystine lyase
MVSHVTYGTGALLPLDEIVQVAHDAGVEVLVDGAQSVGAVPVDMMASGADYLAFPSRKWLFGPDGTGALYVHPARLGDLHPRGPRRPREPRPTAVDADTFHDAGMSGDMEAFRDIDTSGRAGAFRDAVMSGNGFYDDRFRNADVDPTHLPAGAARFDRHGGYQPLASGWSASLDWLDSLGWPAVHATIAARTGYALARAADLPGSHVLTPVGASAGIVAFTVAGVDPVACVEFLAQNAVAVRSIPENGAIRVSCSFFTTVDEIDRVFSLVDAFRRRS